MMGRDVFWDTVERLTPQLRAGDLASCESEAITALLALPPSPFHIAAKLDISNDPMEAAKYFDGFVRAESKRVEIMAVYTEMNGFSINPDLWFCSPFAYTTDGGMDDWDWLSDWQSSDDFENYTIAGLEELQAVYAQHNKKHDPAHQETSNLCDLVVITKFQRFMQRAAAEMKDVRVPLYVTAHDYDFIARIMPGK